MLIAVAAVCVQAHPGRAWGQEEAKSAAAWVKEGNELLASDRHAEALAAFERARKQAPESAVVAYDRGVALYRLGRFEEAETAFQDAMRPEMPELEAKAKYNLGRCAHAQAAAGAEDLETAIHNTGRAIGYYKEALQLRPDDGDAKRNLLQAERLQQYLKKKIELIQQQQQEQPSSQPSDQKQEPSSQPEDQEASSQPNEQSEQSTQPGEEGESEESASQPQESEGEEGESQNEREQREASSRPDEGEQEQEMPEPATQPQKQPATQSATQPDEEATTRPATMATTQPDDAEAQLLRLSREQALRMLQEARDAERQRREVLREMLMRQQGRIPVDKDW